ncbi:MAG: tRNA (adenosine(37)-N6)-threonylcarbamoyltransferase complex dimerization subunit type 1 TsaB [Bacillota bacterium]|jgi:tRNA threonylcarbamoyladenosine biosynthesis protein TsaB|nr:tRNA (adenosine(37)-N6)-threonylcarbamoyltransferase complex dimerization subunit type 1 TsaB [Candidatus Fermentithermobacillaceae bacterium]
MLDGEIAILAIETTTSLMGAAVVVGEEVVSEGFVDKPKVHSYKLLPMCDWVLSKARLDPRLLSAVAVSIGPGSFTGLRIGCATAQGLAHAWGKRVVPVPTFSVLVEQARKETQGISPVPNIAAVQGRARAQTVTALYSHEGTELVPPEGRSLEEFALEIKVFAPDPVIAVGDACDLLVDHVKSENTGGQAEAQVATAGERTRLPLPGTVGLLAVGMWKKGLSVEPKAAIPVYYRKHQAEVKMARKRTNERRD